MIGLTKALKEANDDEENYKKQLGKVQQNVVSEIESILSKNHIEKPYYHGGKYNGKAMVRLMDYKHASKVLDNICSYLLSIPQVDRCPNTEVDEWIAKFKKNLSVFDGVFSIARMKCGTVHEEHIVNLEQSIKTAMKLWRGLGNSVSPKPHAIEDHLVDQIRRFTGIGDFCEDFVEKSHQDGIIDHSRTKNSMSQEEKAKQHCHREHKRLLPSVQHIMRQVNCNSKRHKTVLNENGAQSKILVSKSEQRETKISEEKKVREEALQITIQHQGLYLQSGRDKYIQEAARKQHSVEIIQQHF
jgi:hypothetical protein